MKRKIALVALLIGIFSCKDEHDVPNNNIMPDPINLVILDNNGKSLINKHTSPLIIYYLDKDGKRQYSSNYNFASIGEFGDSSKWHYYYADLGISIASARSGIRTSFLEFNGKTDTLYLDFEKFSTPSQDPRRGTYYLKEAKINGAEWKHDESVIPYVFIVNR